MKQTLKTTAVATFAAMTILASGTVSAGPSNPASNTENLAYTRALKIHLPRGMCEFDGSVPSYVVNRLNQRRDWNKLVAYMLANCPELGLPLADTATASIEPIFPQGNGNLTGNRGPAGRTIDGPGGSSVDVAAAGSSEDQDNGHGNEDDGHDESNPGKGSKK